MSHRNFIIKSVCIYILYLVELCITWPLPQFPKRHLNGYDFSNFPPHCFSLNLCIIQIERVGDGWQPAFLCFPAQDPQNTAIWHWLGKRLVWSPHSLWKEPRMGIPWGLPGKRSGTGVYHWPSWTTHMCFVLPAFSASTPPQSTCLPVLACILLVNSSCNWQCLSTGLCNYNFWSLVMGTPTWSLVVQIMYFYSLGNVSRNNLSASGFRCC